MIYHSLCSFLPFITFVATVANCCSTKCCMSYLILQTLCMNCNSATRFLSLIIATAVNPAIMATKNNVEVLQGSSIKLEVYVSGYPIPTESDITWKRPNLREISDLDDTVDFQDGHRRLTLSNIQPHQSGLYSVTVSLPPNRVARTGVYLNVYCKQVCSHV